MDKNIIKKKFYQATGLKIGRRINSTVHSLKDHPNKVVKIEAVHDFEGMLALLKNLKSKNYKSIAKIFDYGTFEIESQLAGDINYKYYYYVMEKLNPLPYNHEDAIIDVFSSYYKINYHAPSFLSKKLISFIAEVNKLKYFYADIHGGNIMLDRFGNYKFVDLESFLQNNY